LLDQGFTGHMPLMTPSSMFRLTGDKNYDLIVKNVLLASSSA